MLSNKPWDVWSLALFGAREPQTMCVCCFTNERPSVFLYKLVQSKVSKLKSRYVSQAFSCTTSFPCTWGLSLKVVCLTLTQRMLMSWQQQIQALEPVGKERSSFHYFFTSCHLFGGTYPNLCLTLFTLFIAHCMIFVFLVHIKWFQISGKCLKWMHNPRES